MSIIIVQFVEGLLHTVTTGVQQVWLAVYHTKPQISYIE